MKEEHKIAISKAHKKAGVGLWMKGRKRSLETRMKMSLAHIGNKNAFYGKKHTKETIEKLSGKNNYRWEGGVERNQRNDGAYKQWRKSVLKNSPKCILGINCSGYRIAHHLLYWAKYPKHRYNISNGVTLCQFHHKKAHGITT